MEIQIPIQNTKKQTLKVKKPYTNFHYDSVLQDFIFYDRYRFQVGLNDINLNNNLSMQLLKLRKSDEIVYLNLNLENKMLILTKDQKVYEYIFENKQLQEITKDVPKQLLDKINIPKLQSGFMNKYKEGRPKYEILNNCQTTISENNLKQININEYSIQNIEIIQCLFGFILKNKEKCLLYSNLNNNQQEITLINDYDDIDILEVQDLLVITAYYYEKQRFQIKQQIYKYNDKSKQLERKQYLCSFIMNQNLKNFQQIDYQQKQFQFIKVKNLVTNKYNLKTCIGINDFKSQKFELYLIDQFEYQKVIDLKIKVHQELLESTRHSFIDSIVWQYKVYQNFDLLIISFTNGNILCFDQNGNQVRMLSENMYNQGIIQNREMFLQDFSLENLNFEEIKQAKYIYNKLNRIIIQENKLYKFNGYIMTELQMKFITKQDAIENQIAHQKLQIYKDFPLVTLNSILIKDSLYVHPFKVFSNLLLILRNGYKHYDYREIMFILTNSIKFMMQQNQDILAYQTVNYINKYFDKFKFKNQISNDLKQKVVCPQFQDSIEILINQNFKAKVFTIKQENTNNYDKSQLSLQYILIIFKLLFKLKSLENSPNINEIQFDNFLKLVKAFNIVQHSIKDHFQTFSQMKQYFIDTIKDFSFNLKNQSDYQENESILKNRYAALRLKKIVRKNLISKILYQLLQSDDSNKLEKSILMFKQDHQSLNLLEQKQLLIIFQIIIEQKQIDTQIVTLKLPQYLKSMSFIKNLSKLQFNKFMSFTIPKYTGLNDNMILDSLSIILNNQNYTQKQSINLQQLLYQAKIQQEFQLINPNNKKQKHQYFLQLMKMFKTQKLPINITTATYQYLIDLQLEDICSQSPIQIVDMIFILSKQKQQNCEQQQQQQQYQSQIPKFIFFLLQNLNRLTLQQIKTYELPSTFAINNDNLRTINALFETLQILFQNYKISFDLNLQTLANATTMELGLSQIMRFQEYEDKMHQQMAGNQISARYKVYIDQNLYNTKIAIWKIILLIWQIQCEFRGINQNRKDSQQFLFRSQQIQQALGLRINKQKQELKLDNINKEIIQTYSVKSKETVYNFIGRIILDENFKRFLTNLPKLFQIYAKKNQQNLEYNKTQADNLLKLEYQRQYQIIKKSFGLKLNYTIYYDHHSNEHFLLKRFNKSWLSQISKAPKPLKENKVRDITKQIQEPLEIISSKDEILIQDEVQVESKQDQLDKSFFSENEDLLNKSALLNISQINEDKTDRYNVDKEEIKKMINKNHDRTQSVYGVSLNENKSEFDIFSRASSGQQEDINIPIDELFNRKRSQRLEITSQQIDSKSQRISLSSQRERIKVDDPIFIDKLTQKLMILEMIIWRKQTQYKYSAIFQMKLVDELNKSQDRLKNQFQQRYSTIEHQDITTQQSAFDNDSQTNNNHFTSINYTERSMKPPKPRIRYETPNKENHHQQQRFRSFSPEEENKNQFSRLEYSPIILDDTEQSEDERMSQMIDPNFNFKGRDTLGFKQGLDTSRFAYGQENKNVIPELDITERSNLTNLTYFIDPNEHLKTLKSPIVTPKKKSKVSINKEFSNKVADQVILQKSPVHFNDPNKYDYANDSKILSKVHLLGAEQLRNKSFRVVNHDGNVSPKMFKFMLLKPQQQIGMRSFKLPDKSLVQPQQQNQTIRLLKFKSQK